MESDGPAAGHTILKKKHQKASRRGWTQFDPTDMLGGLAGHHTPKTRKNLNFYYLRKLRLRLFSRRLEHV